MPTASSRTALLALILVSLTIAIVPVSTAQTFTVLHNFTGGADGGLPYAGLVMDQAGNLYGTTTIGGGTNCGGDGCGVVFKMSQKNSSWTLDPLYSFSGGLDGASPYGPVVIGPSGTIYGVTSFGGGSGCDGMGCGTVYSLRPSATVCKTTICHWSETLLYSFQGGTDGADPGSESLLIDKQGNIYGTTSAGGAFNYGTVFQLTLANGSWTKTTLYNFTGGADGSGPSSGVIMDAAGNLYGTAVEGGYGAGTVYELSPFGSGWTETTLYKFQNQSDGRSPIGGLILQSGILYGTASEGGELLGGTVFSLTPNGGQGGFSIVESLPGNGYLGPTGSLATDQLGRFYGASVFGNGANGQVWGAAGFYFSGCYGSFPGINPYGSVVVDSQFNVYGTALVGGGCSGVPGEVWEFTP
ncbi:MAG: choice-of-anchor tandem repeat GloVer-containing protein [Candidatus Korobacteraceae bacterium]